MYDTLKITFRNGAKYVYHKNEWYDWCLCEGFWIVKNEEDKWVACFNAKDVFSVEMFKDDTSNFECLKGA